MKSLKGIPLAFFTMFFLTAQLAQAAGKSLSETLSWIDSTYNSHAKDGGSQGHGMLATYDRKGNLLERRTDTFGYEGCKISLKHEDDPKSPEFENSYTFSMDTFNLGDIDPKSLRITIMRNGLGWTTCDSNGIGCPAVFELVFETRNQKPVISVNSRTIFQKVEGVEHEKIENRNSYETHLILDDMGYADRFSEAFRNAVNLCGGSPSAF
jgi:hypothetical protein